MSDASSVSHDHPQDLSVELTWSRADSKSGTAFLVEFKGIVCRRCGWRRADVDEFRKLFAKSMINLRRSLETFKPPESPDETRVW